MRKTPLILAVALAFLFSAPMVSAETSDEPWMPDDTWYCYGNIMTLDYPYDIADLTVDWEIIGYSMGVPGEAQYYSGPKLLIDVRDYDVIHVKQTVMSTSTGDSDSSSVEVIPLGLKPGESITVRFVDGYNEVGRDVFDKDRSVKLGSLFVYVPEDPTRTNYRFTGWYYDQECTQKFDPYAPVTRDTTVYAGWASAGSSGSIDVSGHIVTFNAAPGLTYQVVGTGDMAVSFTVSVMDGYRFDMDSIQASVGTTKISPVNGIYTLSGITKDTVIEITGDRLYSVSYDMTNVSVSSESLGKDSLSVSFSPSFGWSGVSLKVIMDGVDVTSQYVNGSSVDIGLMTGDVIILAQADFPWIYVLIIVIVVVIVVVIALAAVLLVRKRKDD